jgi:hypothetical protein
MQFHPPLRQGESVLASALADVRVVFGVELRASTFLNRAVLRMIASRQQGLFAFEFDQVRNSPSSAEKVFSDTKPGIADPSAYMRSPTRAIWDSCLGR